MVILGFHDPGYSRSLAVVEIFTSEMCDQKTKEVVILLKDMYVRDLLGAVDFEGVVNLLCWIRARRRHGKTVFIDLTDSTGTIQAVASENDLDKEVLEVIKKISLESSVCVSGVLSTKGGKTEILIKGFEVIGENTLKLQPYPRKGFDVFSDDLAGHIIANKAIYLREPHYMAILKFRAKVMRIIRDWFEFNGYMEFDAPILVLSPLYDDRTAMAINVHGQDLFLTQCAGFFLEAAAMAFEKVYNMGPSFRGEESRSKRHLKEYWHIKAELAFGDRNDIISIVENLLSYLYEHIPVVCAEEMGFLDTVLRPEEFRIPFARITYKEAVEYVCSQGSDTKLGESISSGDEELLAKLFDGPFWVLGIPRSIEPFPYSIDEENLDLTKVADLIAPRGYGELCGVAEKIHKPDMLVERMKEKCKHGDPRYQFVVDVHKAGCVPHIAFGMGLERLLR